MHEQAGAGAGVAQADAAMAVLVQQQLAADAAFVLHTRSPVGGEGELLAEVALGLGETLASGTRGSPWRLSVDKATGLYRTLCRTLLTHARADLGRGARRSPWHPSINKGAFL